MLAHELAREFPIVGLDSDALEVTRLLAGRRLPGLIVVDSGQHPVAVLPGSQILRFVVPGYVQDDPALARVYGEKHADRLCDSLSGRTVRDLLPADRQRLPIVEADATAMEIAALMAAAHSPLVAVVESRDGKTKNPPMIGAITITDLLEWLLPAR